MRIVGGTWRGRRITAPRGSVTRPTSDRVREALFSMLTARFGAALDGASVLDAFAGTGALGLEALSRGAAHATFVERDPRALESLRANVDDLASDGATLVSGDVFALGKRGGPPGGPFSLILLDPPYRIDWAQVRSLLSDLDSSNMLDPDAIVVYEHAAGTVVEWPDEFVEHVQKTYGDTAIAIAVVARGA